MESDDLYGLPLDRFVAERAALAKALRARKQRAAASAVAALRKPSTAAWAVNQVVRARPRELNALFEAGDALRQAQTDLLAGGLGGRELRAVADRERAAVDGLLDAARGLLSTEGAELSATVLERVAETLHAAALDHEAREHVRGGTLVQERRHVGFGLGDGQAAALPQPPARPSGAIARSATSARTDAERAKRERAVRDEAARARAQARKQARAAEAAARGASERAEHAVRAAEQRRDRTAEALDKAEDALTAARATAAAAREQQQQARTALDEL